MPPRRTITLRAQWLGQQLRAAREVAGVSIQDIADYMGRNPSTVSRIETGMLTARTPEVLTYLDLCCVQEPKREALRQLARDVFRKGWWDGYGDTLNSEFADRIWLESRSQLIHMFHHVVPGLLQTADYAKAMIRGDEPDLADDRVTEGVRIRLARQAILSGDHPSTVEVLLDETALLRTIGTGSVMTGQLQHLLGLTQLPHVSMHIVPLAIGSHPGLSGPFDVLHMSEPYPEVGYVETRAGVILVEGPAVDRLSRAYRQLRLAALTSDQTADLIASTIARLQ